MKNELLFEIEDMDVEPNAQGRATVLDLVDAADVLYEQVKKVVDVWPKDEIAILARRLHEYAREIAADGDIKRY